VGQVSKHKSFRVSAVDGLEATWFAEGDEAHIHRLDMFAKTQGGLAMSHLDSKFQMALFLPLLHFSGKRMWSTDHLARSHCSFGVTKDFCVL
jgi:hypothetical protein